MGRKRRGKQKQVEEEAPYTVEELEAYVDSVCYDMDELRDYPRRYRINLGAEAWNYVDHFLHTLKMSIKPTRYMDEDCMEALGIRDDVLELFENIGWTEFLSIRKPTYKELTMEVLCTIRMEREENDKPAAILFRLGNQDRRLTKDEINHIFRTPENIEDPVMIPGRYNEQWVQLARRNQEDEPVFNPSNSKASRIRNPVFRYIQRVLANTVFARAEVGPVRREELLLMSCMIDNTRVGIATFLMNQLYKQCTTSVFQCQIGGLITHIADHFESTHHLQFPPVAGEMRLDLKALRKMRVVRKIGNTHCLVLEGEEPFPLPNTELTTSRGKRRGNWALLSPVHAQWSSSFHESREQPQQQVRREAAEERQPRGREEQARVRSLLRGESSRSQAIPNEEPSRLATLPPIHSTYQRRDPEIRRLNRRMDGFTTQIADLAAAQTRIVERQTRTDEYLQEFLNRQKIMFDWHVNEGHFPPYHPPQ